MLKEEKYTSAPQHLALIHKNLMRYWRGLPYKTPIKKERGTPSRRSSILTKYKPV